MRDAARRRWLSFHQDQGGGILVIFCLSFLLLVGIAGGAVDFARISNTNTSLHARADAAALAGANEFRIGANDAGFVADVAKQVAIATLSNKGTMATVNPVVDTSTK